MIILFASEYAYKTFYDCSFLSQEQWWKEGKPSLFHGILYIVPGSFFMILYIPIGLIFLKKELIELTCYKFMFFIFILDEICLVGCSTFSGIMAIQGAVFCNYPRISWIFGMVCMSSWSSCCSMCVFMAVNRCFDIVKPKINHMLFRGNRAFLWMVLSIVYGIFIGTFNKPMFFSSKTYGWYYDPYFGTNTTGLIKYNSYLNYPHMTNNFLVVILLTTLYTYFCATIIFKFRSSEKVKITKTQKSLLIQSSILCLINFGASVIYIYVQFAESSIILVIIAHMAWIFTHGFISCIYLIFNKAIQKKFAEYFFLFKKKNISISEETRTKIRQKSTMKSIHLVNT